MAAPVAGLEVTFFALLSLGLKCSKIYAEPIIIRTNNEQITLSFSLHSALSRCSHHHHQVDVRNTFVSLGMQMQMLHLRYLCLVVTKIRFGGLVVCVGEKSL